MAHSNVIDSQVLSILTGGETDSSRFELKERSHMLKTALHCKLENRVKIQAVSSNHLNGTI